MFMCTCVLFRASYDAQDHANFCNVFASFSVASSVSPRVNYFKTDRVKGSHGIGFLQGQRDD